MIDFDDFYQGSIDYYKKPKQAEIIDFKDIQPQVIDFTNKQPINESNVSFSSVYDSIPAMRQAVQQMEPPTSPKSLTIKMGNDTITTDTDTACRLINEGVQNVNGNYETHYCTRWVSNALRGRMPKRGLVGGLAAGPSQMYDVLKNSGWREAASFNNIDNYKPQKGDVFVAWDVPGFGMHTSMYDGSKWISYKPEGDNKLPFNTTETKIRNANGRGHFYVMRNN